MSKVVATTVLPEDSGEVLTFGDTGDASAISGDSLNLNKLQDAGGNNIFTSDGSGTLTVPSAFGGAFNLLTTNTFTGSTTSNFTTLIDSTYDVYIFKWNAVNPATDQAYFTFQCSTDGGSNYNVSMTTTIFSVYHYENDTGSVGPNYDTGQDQAQGTSYQTINRYCGSAADACAAGELYLFAPSNTTFMKQFYAVGNNMEGGGAPGTMETFSGGYFDTTTALNAISFKMSTGNMDGEIKMYGISKS